MSRSDGLGPETTSQEQYLAPRREETTEQYPAQRREENTEATVDLGIADLVRLVHNEQRTLIERQAVRFQNTMTLVINLIEENKSQVGILNSKFLDVETQVGKITTQLEQARAQASNPSFSGFSGFGGPSPTVVFSQQDTPPLFDPAKRFGSGRYLEDLELYFQKRQIPEERKLEVAIEGLQGHAKNWATVYKSSWKTFDDFRSGFQNYFWSLQDQGKVRHQINSGRWKSESTLSEHFAYMASLANLLTNPIPEDILVEELIRHFPTHIQALWSLKAQHTLREAMTFLKQQEDIGNGVEHRQQSWDNPPAVAPAKRQTQPEASRYNPYSYRKEVAPKTSTRTQPIQVIQTSFPVQGNEHQSG